MQNRCTHPLVKETFDTHRQTERPTDTSTQRHTYSIDRETSKCLSVRGTSKGPSVLGDRTSFHLRVSPPSVTSKEKKSVLRAIRVCLPACLVSSVIFFSFFSSLIVSVPACLLDSSDCLSVSCVCLSRQSFSVSIPRSSPFLSPACIHLEKNKRRPSFLGSALREAQPYFR